MSPQDISPDTRPAILLCRRDMLRLQVDNSGHRGACVRHNSFPPLSLLLLLPSMGMLKAALMYSFFRTLIKSLITTGFGRVLQHIYICSSFNEKKHTSSFHFRFNGPTSWKPMIFKMLNFFGPGVILLSTVAKV